MRVIVRAGFWAVLAAFAFVVSSCSSSTGPGTTPTATAAPTPVRAEEPQATPGLSDDPNTGYSVGSTEELGWAPPDDEAARRADLIVVARVDEPGQPFWTTLTGTRPGVTVDGKLPKVPEDQLRWGSRPQIFTPWTFTVIEKLKGQLPESVPIIVNRWGGSIPPDEFVTYGEVAFVPGDKIVLFLRDCGTAHSETYGTPFRFMKRHVVYDDGTVLNYQGDGRTHLQDLLDLIAREKDGLPITEMPCD